MSKNLKILIKGSDLSRLTSISGNMDKSAVVPFIKMAQDCNIKSILGDDLYSKIENDFINNSLDGDYLEIYENYVVDMLVYYSAYFVISLHNYKISNNGILKSAPDNFETIDISEIEKLAQQYRQLGASVELRFNNNKHRFKIPELNKNCGDSQNDGFKMPFVF